MVALRFSWIDFKEEHDMQVANLTKSKLHYNRHFLHRLESKHANQYKNVTDFATRKRKEEKEEKERKEQEEIQAAIFRVQVMEARDKRRREERIARGEPVSLEYSECNARSMDPHECGLTSQDYEDLLE